MPEYPQPLYQGDKKIGVSGPITKWTTVTPDDDNDFTNGACRAITVKDDTGGNLVAVMFLDGTTETLYIPKGYVHPTVATRVLATGTTATTVQIGH